MTDTANDATPLPAARARIAQTYEMMFPRTATTSTQSTTDDMPCDAASTAEQLPASPQPAWSGKKAFLLGWLLPSTTAQRTQDLSLRRAWLVHVAAVLIAPVVIFLAIQSDDVQGSLTLTALMNEVKDALGNFGNKFDRHPIRTPFAILGVFALVEVGHAALALLMMAWGARDEPLRNSYRNAIRQVWIRTTHVIPVVLVFAAVEIPLSRMNRDWNAGYSVPEPEWPQPPSSAAPGSKAMTEYNKALQEYWPLRSAWQEQRNSVKPWYLVASTFLIGLTVFCGITWVLWALLRSIGAPRRVAPIARPPTCEACGYNLLTIPEDSRCPECARPVLASIGPDARPGPAWQMRHATGRISAWYRCARDSIIRSSDQPSSA